MTTTDPRFRELDPADHLTADQLDPSGERARAMLAQITATDPNAAVSSPAALPTLQRRRLRTSLGVAAALVVGGTVGPAALGLNSASAQWVALPTGVPAADAQRAAEPCRELLGPSEDGPDGPTRAAVDAMPVVVAEDRGNWRYVVLSDGTWEMSCLIQRSLLDRVLGRFGPSDLGSGGGGITGLRELPLPAATEVRSVEVMTSSVSGTLRPTSTVSSTTGRVGADVVGVVVEPAGRPKVTATVANGWYAAWWPEEASDPATSQLPPPASITVTLRDGTTRHFAADSDQATPMSGSGTSRG